MLILKTIGKGIERLIIGLIALSIGFFLSVLLFCMRLTFLFAVKFFERKDEE